MLWRAISVKTSDRNRCSLHCECVAKAIIAPYRAIVNFRNYFRAVESPPPCGRRRTGRYNGVLLSHQNLNVLVVNSGLRSLGSITPKRAESDSETLNTMSRMTRKTLVPGDRYWRFWTRPRHGLDWGIDGWQQQYFEEMQHQTAAGEKLFLIILISPPVLSSHYCALSCVSKLHKYNSANNQPTPLLPDWPALLIAVLSFPQLAISWSTFTGIEAMTTTT